MKVENIDVFSKSNDATQLHTTALRDRYLGIGISRRRLRSATKQPNRQIAPRRRQGIDFVALLAEVKIKQVIDRIHQTDPAEHF